MIVALTDSNPILDVFTNDPVWAGWSESAVAICLTVGQIAINPIVYSEVGVGFDRKEDLDARLPEDQFVRVALPFEAAFLAAQAHALYRRRGGTRPTPLADFYIGAHATVAGLPLLTRDARHYRTYFPNLSIIGPTS